MTIAWSILVVGVIALLASALFDGADLGGWAGKTSPLAIGLFLTVVGGIAVVAGATPIAWLLAVPAGVAAHGVTQRIEKALYRRATGELPSSNSLVGTTLVVESATDANGRNGTASIVVGGVHNRILIDSDQPLSVGDEVWVESIDSTASRAQVRPTRR